MKKYFLHIRTWEGIAPGAMHYYGRIHGEYRDYVKRHPNDSGFTHEEYDVEREKGKGLLSQFHSRQAVIDEAIKTFFRLKLKGILYIGESSTAQPQRVLIAPKSLLEKARQENRLWKRMEHYYEIGGLDPWKKYSTEMDAILKEWDALWK